MQINPKNPLGKKTLIIKHKNIKNLSKGCILNNQLRFK